MATSKAQTHRSSGKQVSYSWLGREISLCRKVSVFSHSSYFIYFLLLSRQRPMGLIVAFDKDTSARGELFWDDGDSIGKKRLHWLVDNCSQEIEFFFVGNFESIQLLVEDCSKVIEII